MKINSHVSRGLSQIKCTNKVELCLDFSKAKELDYCPCPCIPGTRWEVILSVCPTLRSGCTPPRQLFSTELFSGWPVTSQTKQSIHSLAGGKLVARPASTIYSSVQKCVGLTQALTLLFPSSCFVTGSFFFCNAFWSLTSGFKPRTGSCGVWERLGQFGTSWGFSECVS